MTARALSLVLLLAGCSSDPFSVDAGSRTILDDVQDDAEEALPYVVRFNPWQCAVIYTSKINPAQCYCSNEDPCIADANDAGWHAIGCASYPQCEQIWGDLNGIPWGTNFPGHP